ncbi:MAG: hypothetical protein KGL39_00210 [Patescibacteria group bacterium]|nr:hypothetical protein [Patescibacteria group bacterium]
MAIARSRGALIGTDETTGVTLANNGTAYTNAGSVTTDIDMLGDDKSIGDVWLYVVFTSTVTAGTLDLTISSHRNTALGYVKTNPDVQIAPINGTQKIPLGKRPCERYLAVKALNNATGANITNLSVLYTLEKLS